MTGTRPLAPSETRWNSRFLPIAGAYVLAYVLLDALSSVQPVLKLGITPWSPQAGLTLALLLRFGAPSIPVVALAAFVSEILVRGTPESYGLAIVACIWIGVGYGALAYILRARGLNQPIRTSSAAAWLAGASLVATLAVAAGYIGLFVLEGSLPRDEIFESFARYWVGDLNGIVMLTPLLIQAREWRAGLRAVWERRGEALAQLAVVLFALWVIFGVTVTDELRFFYPLFVPIIWIALRWGVTGAMLAALLIQIGVVLGASDDSRGPPLIELQFLMVTLGMTALLLGAAVTERARALRQVAVREAEQRALLAMAPDAVLVVDPTDRVNISNPAALRLFGARADARNRPALSEVLPGLVLQAPEGRAALDARRGDDSSFPAEIAWARLDAPANEGFLVTVRDVSDRRRAEAQLRERDTALARAMRFAVAGELASALTHELNQPITALVSYLRACEILAKPLAKTDDRLDVTLRKAVQEGIRASEVLRRLRDFYRGGAFKRERVHLPSVCTAVAAAFQERLARAGVSLEQRIDPDVPVLEADVTQIEIVLHNLLANAIDAVSTQPAGQRRIELSATRGDGVVMLRVEDSGPGLPTTDAQKAFEPFFTSKPDGMGLGLAISRSLVRERGGELFHEPGTRLGGASFVVRLPVEVPADARCKV